MRSGDCSTNILTSSESSRISRKTHRRREQTVGCHVGGGGAGGGDGIESADRWLQNSLGVAGCRAGNAANDTVTTTHGVRCRVGVRLTGGPFASYRNVRPLCRAPDTKTVLNVNCNRLRTEPKDPDAPQTQPEAGRRTAGSAVAPPAADPAARIPPGGGAGTEPAAQPPGVHCPGP